MNSSKKGILGNHLSIFSKNDLVDRTVNSTVNNHLQCVNRVCLYGYRSVCLGAKG